MQKKTDRELSEITESRVQGQAEPEQIKDLVGYIRELAGSGVAVQK